MTRERPKTVLAVGAHPDSVEKTCAGTLALLSKAGWKVVIATMTPGDKGSRSLSSESIANVRKQEARESSALIDGTYHCLEWRELAVFFGDMACRRTTALIRDVRPHLVLTHPPRDCLPDFEQTSLIVRHACHASVVPNYVVPGYPGDSIPPPIEAVPHLYYFDAIEGMDVLGDPIAVSVIVDVTSTRDKKRRMLAKHDSQRQLATELHGLDDYVSQVESLNKNTGKRAEFEYGEGFRQHVGHGFPRNELLSGVLGECVELVEPA